MTDIVERLNDMGTALCRGGDAEAGEFLCKIAADIEEGVNENGRLRAALNAIEIMFPETEAYVRRALGEREP